MKSSGANPCIFQAQAGTGVESPMFHMLAQAVFKLAYAYVCMYNFLFFFFLVSLREYPKLDYLFFDSPIVCSNIFGIFISDIAPTTGDEDTATTIGPKNVLGTTPGNCRWSYLNKKQQKNLLKKPAKSTTMKIYMKHCLLKLIHSVSSRKCT